MIAAIIGLFLTVWLWLHANKSIFPFQFIIRKLKTAYTLFLLYLAVRKVRNEIVKPENRRNSHKAITSIVVALICIPVAITFLHIFFNRKNR